MQVFISRHRILYTPTDGDTIELLLPLDYCEREPEFVGGPQTQQDDLLLAPWAAHHSRGNIRMRLSFDRYVKSSCLAQAAADMLTHWKLLNEQPEGVLLYDTAFMGFVSVPLVQWSLQATLNSVTVREMDIDSAPFDGVGYHARYDFNISFKPATHG